jgi:hypothetical protein
MHCAGKISFFPAASRQMHCKQVENMLYVGKFNLFPAALVRCIASELNTRAALSRLILPSSLLADALQVIQVHVLRWQADSFKRLPTRYCGSLADALQAT